MFLCFLSLRFVLLTFYGPNDDLALVENGSRFSIWCRIEKCIVAKLLLYRLQDFHGVSIQH